MVKRLELNPILVLVVLLVLGIFSPGDLRAQVLYLPIGEVLKDANHDFQPDRLYQIVNVRGIVTGDPRRASGVIRANIQDDTGGIMIASPSVEQRRLGRQGETNSTENASILMSNEDARAVESGISSLHLGDEVSVRGKVSQFFGREMLIVMELQVVGQKPLPKPRDVSAAELNSEKYSGQLVRVTGELEIPEGYPDKTPDINLRDKTGNIAVYIASGHFKDPRFSAQLFGRGKASVIGFAAQIDGDPPYDGAYRLMPRDKEDFAFHPPPPYREIAIGSVIGSVCLTIFYLWAGLRNARRREREVRGLLEDLRKSDEALQKSEERLRLMIRSMPAVLWAVDTDLKFTYSAGAGLDAIGLKPNDLLGKSLFEYFQTEDHDFKPIAAHRNALKGVSSSYELAWENRTFQAHVQPLLTPEGAVSGCIGVALDITEREQALARWRQSQEMFRLISENVSDFICVINEAGQRIYNSPSYKSVLVEPAAWEGATEFPEIHPDDRERVRKTISESIATGITQRFEFRFLRPDGTLRYVESETSFIPSALHTGRLVMVSRDITERKLIELEREKLVAFPRMNPNPILEISAIGQLNYFNEAAEQMFRSLGQENVIGILPPDYKDIVADCLRARQKKLNREKVLLGRTISWSFYPIESSQVVHCYADDVTDRLYLEEQLRQSKKMESVGQLAAGIAHDFNNILTIIQGYSGLLLAQRNLPEAMAAPLHQITVAAERAANLTRQLLTFSRKQVMQSKPIQLNEVISNVVSMLRRVLGANVDLQCYLARELPQINADTNMMEQVIMNLAVNSRDAMPQGGKLTINTLVRTIDESYTKTQKEATAGPAVCLEITDTGEGMDPATLSRIFEPFFTTKEVGKGTGLGLATVYGIVKQHQGWIEVVSSKGKGTSFRIFFPSLKEVAPPPPTRPAHPVKRGRSEIILVVEDEPGLRNLTKEILLGYGYEVLEAGSGAQALPIWEQNQDKIDLVLTDMVMPEMSGRELVERIRKVKPDQKVIYTSGYSIDMAGKNVSLMEGVNFLAKPYLPGDLGKLVRECLDR